MNTMTNTAELSNHTAQADRSALFPALLKKLFRLFRMSAATNSISQDVLAHHIVME